MARGIQGWLGKTRGGLGSQGWSGMAGGGRDWTGHCGLSFHVVGAIPVSSKRKYPIYEQIRIYSKKISTFITISMSSPIVLFQKIN